jgi:hypothetical protein
VLNAPSVALTTWREPLTEPVPPGSLSELVLLPDPPPQPAKRTTAAIVVNLATLLATANTLLGALAANPRAMPDHLALSLAPGPDRDLIPHPARSGVRTAVGGCSPLANSGASAPSTIGQAVANCRRASASGRGGPARVHSRPRVSRFRSTRRAS